MLFTAALCCFNGAEHHFQNAFYQTLNPELLLRHRSIRRPEYYMELDFVSEAVLEVLHITGQYPS